MSPFTFFYFFFNLFLFILALPFLIYLSFKSKYKYSIPARFFLRHNPKLPEDGIWLHACSLGEVTSLQPIIEKLDGPVRLSCITQTGFAKAKSMVQESRYLPFEIWLPIWVTRQKTLVVLEAELWYLLFLVAKAKGVKTILLSARISDRSFPKYKRFAWFYRRLFKHVDKVFCQSEKDLERLKYLGARNIEVGGNIKAALKPHVSTLYEKQDSLIITAGSTHEGEEEIILKAYERTPEGKLIIAPRHPERFEGVCKLVEAYCHQHQLQWQRFSQNKNLDSDIIVVDTLGELNNLYAISDVVILGGSFAKKGGHNPVEPASFGCKIISGPHIFNQESLFEAVGPHVISQADELGEVLKNIDQIPKSRLQTEDNLEKIIKEIQT